MRDYSKDFAEWRKWRDEKGLPPIYDNPADAGIETDFRVGQQVSFTNEYGVRFEPRRIYHRFDFRRRCRLRSRRRSTAQ